MAVSSYRKWEIYNTSTEETLTKWGVEAKALMAADSNWTFVRFTDEKYPIRDTTREQDVPLETWLLAIGDETTAITTGTAKITFRTPYPFQVVQVKASLTTASSSGRPTFDINESGTTILSTKLSLDINERTSKTSSISPVISDSLLADDAEMTIDVDVAGTGATGAKIYITGFRV